MSCRAIRAELIAYHFGAVERDARARVEAHLLACPACLRELFALKEEIETAASVEGPSPASRERLRRAVARELLGPDAPRSWSWWERPVAFGFASAAVVAALVAVEVVATSGGVAPRSLEPDPPASVETR